MADTVRDLATLQALLADNAPAQDISAQDVRDFLVSVYSDYIKVSDAKIDGTDGGAFNNGAWRTRDINTEDTDTGGHCAIAANQITLQPGTYVCFIRAPGFSVNRHKARLRNITDGATEIDGSSCYSSNGNLVGNDSIMQGRFTIAAAKTFEVQHYCSTTKVNNGFGAASNFGVDEVYTVAEFWWHPLSEIVSSSSSSSSSSAS